MGGRGLCRIYWTLTPSLPGASVKASGVSRIYAFEDWCKRVEG
jgi:hypothetical protein